MHGCTEALTAWQAASGSLRPCGSEIIKTSAQCSPVLTLKRALSHTSTHSVPACMHARNTHACKHTLVKHTYKRAHFVRFPTCASGGGAAAGRAPAPACEPIREFMSGTSAMPTNAAPWSSSAVLGRWNSRPCGPTLLDCSLRLSFGVANLEDLGSTAQISTTSSTREERSRRIHSCGAKANAQHRTR
eukprot:364628-Chlamydomonas_euryale.AAC.5